MLERLVGGGGGAVDIVKVGHVDGVGIELIDGRILVACREYAR